MARAASRRVAVVGGGIAGIAAADELVARGHRVEIFESGGALGGRIAPRTLGDREVCLGGKNVGARYTELRRLLARRGCDDYEYFGPETAQLVRGRPRTLSLRSPRARMRVAARLAARGELLKGRRFLKLAARVREHEVSRFFGDPWFADLARSTGDPSVGDHLGRGLSEVLRHITVRMNGAEPDEAHIGNFGTNLALVIDRFDQLAGSGFAQFTRAAEASHRVHLETPVQALLRDRDGRAVGVLAGERQHDGFDAVILALPASAAAELLADDAELAGELGSVRYFPVAVIVAEYAGPVFPGAFAALAAPAGMALSNAGSYGRDERNVVRLTFSGRAAREHITAARFDPERLLAEAESFLAANVRGATLERVRWTGERLPPGLCAYTREHERVRHAIAERLAARPGLLLAGDYMRGASLEACARSGLDCAAQVEAIEVSAAETQGVVT